MGRSRARGSGRDAGAVRRLVAVVVLNGLFAFAQEYRADRAGQRLRDLLPLSIAVRRDGRVQDVPARDLVLGDRVLLEAGDRVCADLVLREVSALGIDASMLTGETVAVRPDVGERAAAGTWVVEAALSEPVGGGRGA